MCIFAFKRAIVLAGAPRPQFLLTGGIPVIIGTCLGFAVAGELNLILALLAFAAIILLNGGANMVNDYFDHLSGNDWINVNVSPFSAGSRYIQEGIISPRQMLLGGISVLFLGCMLGLLIVALTKSLLILSLGVIGALGAFFWTAPPVKLCYRFIGEPFIFLFFGPLPVLGSYYLQTRVVDINPIIPGIIIGIIIAMVLEINTFADRSADAAANKKTFVVRFGAEAGVKFYRVSILLTYAAAIAGLFIEGPVCCGSFAYLFTLPIGMAAIKKAGAEKLREPALFEANKLTIVHFFVSGFLMSAAFVVFHFFQK
jgi:1,4-dihydroxy-2-naphthoate octaprenyltransferase